MTTAPAFPDALRDRYEPLAALGQGAMGVVFRVRDRRVEREVALKLLRVGDREDARRRFEHEAAMLGRLRHPGILEVYDFGEVGKDMFMVTELLEGASLDQLPPPEDPFAWMMPVAEALDVVHEAGLVHRDVKPANVFRTTDGRIVLLDFGLALDPEVTRQTVAGAVVGTVAYLGPEVLRLEEPGPPADWFAWGVTLFRLVEGRVPFDFDTLLAAAGGQGLVVPELESAPDDPALRAILEGTLRADPATRLGGAAAIEQYLLVPEPAPPVVAPPPPPGRGRPIALAGLLGLAALAGWSIWSPVAAPQAPPPALPRSVMAAAAEAIGEELTANGTRYFRDEEVRDFPSGDPPEGWTPVLSRDYRDWVHLPRLCPALDGAFQWLRDHDGREELSAETWARVEEIDRRYGRLGLPRMVGPYLEGDLDPTFEPRESELVGFPELRSLGPLDGPLGVALHAWRAATAWKKSQDDNLLEYDETKVRPAGVPADLLDFGGLPMRSRVRTILEFAARDAYRRRLAIRWMREPVEQTRRFLFWGHRALAHTSAPKRWSVMAATMIDRLDFAFFSEVSTFPDSIHVQGGPEGLAKTVIQAAAHRNMGEARRQVGLPWKQLVTSRIDRLTHALGRDDGEGVARHTLRRRAVQELLRAQLVLERVDEALAVSREYASLLKLPGGQWHHRDVVKIMGATWGKHLDHPDTRAVLPRVLSDSEALEAEGWNPRDSDYWDEIARLRKRRGK